MLLSFLRNIIKRLPFAIKIYLALDKQIMFIKAKAKFRQDFLTFSKLSSKTNQRFEVDWDNRFPCLNDKTSTTGFDRHYVLHTAWAARIVSEMNPEFHIM